MNSHIGTVSKFQRGAVSQPKDSHVICALVKGGVRIEQAVVKSSISRQACGRDQQAERGGSLNRAPIPPSTAPTLSVLLSRNNSHSEQLELRALPASPLFTFPGFSLFSQD